MASLPSYEEAVSGGHWLDLAAPYMLVRCYSNLCRVSRRFYSQFSPLLWNDPIQTARHLGLHPNDDLDWIVYFITRHAKTVRPSTRMLVTSLDFCVFIADTLSVTSARGHTFTELLPQIGILFPAVRCILIGTKLDYDPADFGRLLKPDAFSEDGSVPMPLILDIAHCGLPLPNNFFHLSYWRQLVFLDMSHLPGSLKGIIKTGTFSRGALPNLRILKLQGRGLTEQSLAPVTEFSIGRLWSLDLTDNQLTDATVHTLLLPCFGADDLTADSSRSDVQGELVHLQPSLPSIWHGWLSYIQESTLSGAFVHPDRYLADAPVYDAGTSRQSRLAGNERLLSDSAQDIKIALAGGLGLPIPDWHDARDMDICTSHASLTHLHLSGNPGLTTEGVEAVFRRSRGHIRHFDCASPAIPTGSPTRPDRNVSPSQKPVKTSRHPKLAGILGRSHIFRPVYASNLQSLRVHHSLVTHTPTLLDGDADSSLSVSSLHYAETVLRKRGEMAYPLTFVPDLNPRLQSLTLAHLPRVSSGPLIDSLVQLLVSAAHQETAIRHTAASLSRRSPTMLRGLRHIQLEFDPWPRRSDDLDAAAALDSMDAAALLHSGADDFSFFKDEAVLPAPRKERVASPPMPRARLHAVNIHSSAYVDVTSSDTPRARLSHYPLPRATSRDSEYVTENVSLDDGCARHLQAVSVWVGTGYAHASCKVAVQAYMANLADPALRANIRPATPDQVAAGVPVGVCVYNLAWDAILWRASDAEVIATASAQKEPRMMDVVAAIRQFRATTRAEHEASQCRGSSPVVNVNRHWMGKLELLLRS